MSTRNASRPKRHCMVVHAYYPVGETRVEREAVALVEHGYEVDVLCLRGANEPAVDAADGVLIYRLPLQRHKGRGRLAQLMEYLAFFVMAFGKLMMLHWQRPYSVVQVHNLPDFLIFAALGPKLTRARLILDLHDLMPEFYAALTDRPMNSWAVRLIAWQEQISCRFADRVVTVTDVWKNTLIRRGVRPEKLAVVMNVADPRLFHRLPQRVAPSTNGRYTTRRDRFNLIYHGTFTHRYGVDLIIRAVAQVQQSIPHIHLSLLGDGETRDELLRLTQELGLEHHVTFSEHVLPATELPERICQADVGIVPNRSNIFTDGLLPTKLMEYVALGIPVIAARTPTIATYFDETMVEFFTPGDADDLARCILALHADRTRLPQVAHNAERFCERYNWANVSADYVALVEQLNT